YLADGASRLRRSCHPIKQREARQGWLRLEAGSTDTKGLVPRLRAWERGDNGDEDSPHCLPLKSSANARASRSAPVACLVSRFQFSVRPGSKTRFFMNAPTSL